MTAVLVLAGLTGVAWLGLLIDERRSRRRPPAGLVRTWFAPCGCLCSGQVVIVPCAVHDPAEPPVEQWAAELGQEES